MVTWKRGVRGSRRCGGRSEPHVDRTTPQAIVFSVTFRLLSSINEEGFMSKTGYS